MKMIKNKPVFNLDFFTLGKAYYLTSPATKREISGILTHMEEERLTFMTYDAESKPAKLWDIVIDVEQVTSGKTVIGLLEYCGVEGGIENGG